MSLELYDLELTIPIEVLIEGFCSWILNCLILIKGFWTKGFRSFDGFEIKGFKINAIRINDSN